MTTLNLKVPDMACGACAETITKALQDLDPSVSVKANTETKAVDVTTSASAEAVKEAITQAGYTVNTY